MFSSIGDVVHFQYMNNIHVLKYCVFHFISSTHTNQKHSIYQVFTAKYYIRAFLGGFVSFKCTMAKKYIAAVEIISIQKNFVVDHCPTLTKDGQTC